MDFEKATARGSNGVPGLVAAVVNKNGDYVYKKTAGYVSMAEDAAPIQFDTTFSIASCTKLITTIAALQCVERGQIALDEPIDDILPELAALPIIEASKDPNKPFSMRKATKKITLWNLLTHTSGVVYDIMDPLVLAATGQGEQSMATKPDILKAFSTPRIFEAGEGWQYGPSIDWAGLLIGRLNHKTLGELCEEHIFKPLGMDLTTFRLDQKSLVREKLANIAFRTPEGALISGQPRLIMEEPIVDDLGGAGLYTSVGDYTRVLADLLKDSPTLLKKETVDKMFTPQLAEGSKSQNGQFEMAHICSRAHVGGSVNDSLRPKLNFGLGGLVTTEDIATEGYYKPKGTLAWSGMTNLMWAVNREKGLAWMYAVQILPWDDRVSMDLAMQFETEVWKMKA